MRTETTILSWHGDQALRDRVVARMHEHRAADTIVRGLYQQFAGGTPTGYRGCAIGCLLDRQPDICQIIEPGGGWHAEVERQFGIPRALAALIDHTFELLPEHAEASDFAVAVAESVPVGRDLSMVGSRLMLDLLVEPAGGTLQLTAEGSDQRAAVEMAAALYRRRIDGDEPSEREWRSARRAANAAGGYIAYSAASATACAADLVDHVLDATTNAATGSATYAYAAYAATTDSDLIDHPLGGVGGQRRWFVGRLIHHIASA